MNYNPGLCALRRRSRVGLQHTAYVIFHAILALLHLSPRHGMAGTPAPSWKSLYSRVICAAGYVRVQGAQGQEPMKHRKIGDNVTTQYRRGRWIGPDDQPNALSNIHCVLHGQPDGMVQILKHGDAANARLRVSLRSHAHVYEQLDLKWSHYHTPLISHIPPGHSSSHLNPHPGSQR